MSTSHIIVVGLLTGATTAYYAFRQRRSPIIWFAVGFFFGLLGLLALFITFARKQKMRGPKVVTAKVAPKAMHPLEQLIPAEQTAKLWYYLDPEHQPLGPMSFHALQSAWDKGSLNKDSYVWNEDLTDWNVLNQIKTS